MSSPPSSAAEAPPWTVKNMPREDREMINRAAQRANQTVAEWLRAAAHRHVQAEREPVNLGMPAEAEGIQEGIPAGLPPSLPVVLGLAKVLPELAGAKGCSRVAAEIRAVLRSHLPGLAAAGMPEASRVRLAAPGMPAEDQGGPDEAGKPEDATGRPSTRR